MISLFGSNSNSTSTRLSKLEQAVNDLDTTKVDKITGKGLSTYDFTAAYKAKLDSIDEDVIDVMRRSLTNKKHRAIFEMLLHTGARASELCNFNLEDIDLDNRIAYIVNGKGGKNRKVYFNQMTAKYLKEYFELRKDNNPAAFISKKGERITPNGVRAILKSLSDKCGVKNIHPHRFRRTLATTLAERGMPLNEIMIILGHANLNTTRIYIATSDKRVSNSYERYCA